MHGLLTYLAFRLLLCLPVLLAISLVVFAMLHLTPGDPAQALLGPRASPEALAEIRQALRLDQSLASQYLHWIGRILIGDMGQSIQLARPVLDEVMAKFANSAILAAASFLFACAGGLLLGVLAAVKRNTWLDRLVMIFSSLGISTPPFWLGIVLIVIFSIDLGLFPSSGMYPIEAREQNLADLLHHLVLPAVTLGAAPLAVIARMTRSSLLEVLELDFMTAARARGLSPGRLILLHALKNAAEPILTIVGLQIGFLLAAGVLVEVVFSWPGLGTLLVESILTRDFPLTQGAVLVVAATYVLANLLVDTAYAVIDPRVQL